MRNLGKIAVRDGYLHIEDAMEILRMPEPEVSEIAVRVKALGRVEEVAQQLRRQLAAEAPGTERARVEVHTWDQLSPFANIARMVDVMTFFIRLMLIAVALVSILNVMLMAVYERVREIGTIAAAGVHQGMFGRTQQKVFDDLLVRKCADRPVASCLHGS